MKKNSNNDCVIMTEEESVANSNEASKCYINPDKVTIGGENSFPQKCFVMMPFGVHNEYNGAIKESNFIYKYIICPGIEKFAAKVNVKVEVIREVDKCTPGSITKSILEHIAMSDICIVDITGLNANVFFELGIRYSLRNKVTILLRQKNTIIPFDISGFKCLTYDCFDPDKAINSISEFLVTGFSNSTPTDSLVFETFPNIKVHIPGMLTSMGGSSAISNILTWDEWWERVLDISRLLKDSFDNGRFVPSAVLGISNGGLMVADLLGREVFKGVPILSLWANRWLVDKSHVDASCYYFDNEYNKALLQSLKDNGEDKITILLTDDLVFTSNTIVQASAFIKKQIGDSVELLFTPLYCREIDYLDTIKEMLPFGFHDGTIFNIKKEEYYKSLITSRSSLPYKKVLGMA